MRFVDSLSAFLMKIPVVRGVLLFFHRHSLPGFEGLSIYDVAYAFFKGISKSSLTDRAAAITFKFFMGMFPLLLFLCTIIPLIPIEGLQEKLLQLYSELMPAQVSVLLNDAIQQAISRPDRGLMSLSFLAALFFSSNGVVGMMKAMNDSAHLREKAAGGNKRIRAVLILSLVFFMTLIAIVFLVFSSKIIDKYFSNQSFMAPGFLLNILNFLVIYTILFITIATIYYLAPAKSFRKGFISPGAILATNVSIIASFLLSLFFQNFDNYNRIYGTIGSFPILMLWIYINSLVLLIGFELNVSISAGRIVKRKAI